MAQIILIEDVTALNDIYSLNLKMYLGGDLIPKKNHEEAIELLKSHFGIDLIISKNMVGSDKTAVLIHKYIKLQGRNIPMVVLGEEPLLEKYAQLLPENVDIKTFIKTCASCLGITPKEMVEKVVEDYFKIPVFYYLALEVFLCDVYLKVQGQEGIEFVKKFSQNSKVELSEIQSIIKKGVKNLYIPKEFRLKFTDKVTSFLSRQLSNENLGDEEKMQLNSHSMEVVRNQIMTVGFSEDAVELTLASINSVKQLVVANPQLNILLSKLLKNKTSYHYKHCQIITYICYHAIEQLRWGAGEQQKLMAFVSFFHDICLERDELVKIENEETLKKTAMTNIELEQVRKHALDASILLESFPRAPMSAEIIIRNHHGAVGGIGFPKSFSNNIFPLAIVFIIAEEFAHNILLDKESCLSKEEFFRYLNEKYPRSNYRKVIASLERLQY